MTPGGLQIEIKSRTVGQTVGAAMRLMQARKKNIFSAWLFYSVPVLFFSLLLLQTSIDRFWLWLLVLGFAPIFSLPFVMTVGHLVFSETIDFKLILKQSFKRFIPHFFLILSYRLATFVGFFALIFPGFLFWRAGWFLGPVIALEGGSFSDSISRSRQFAAGFHEIVFVHGLNVLGWLIYWMVIITSVLYIFLNKIVGMNIEIFSQWAFYDNYFHILWLTAYALSIPLVTLIWFFVYLEVRTRKEGWDLEIAFREKAEQMNKGGRSNAS